MAESTDAGPSRMEHLPDDPPPPPPSKPRSKPPAQSSWPAIRVVRPPQGKYSPRTDERCLTYCSQSIRGRIERKDPWCRSICIRRVFAHEVQALTSMAETEQGSSSKPSLKYPLPPEGQPKEAIVDGFIGGTEGHHRATADKVRYWEEGWYLWFSKSRWTAQEKLDMMMSDIPRQTAWIRMKQKMDRDWLDAEAKRASEPIRRTDSQASYGSEAEEVPPSHPLKRPFPDTNGDSFLLPLPPPFPPIFSQIQTLLAPSGRAIAVLNESFSSGTQRELAGRVWEKAFTRDPFVLAKNVCSRMWERWKDGPPDDDDGDTPKDG